MTGWETMTGISDDNTGAPNEARAGNARAWRNWSLLVLSLGAVASVALWFAVVLIDPFSTGRFALTQRIDITTTNSRLADAALARDPRFNGAILGDSVAITLDPAVVARGSSWRLVQLGLYAAGAAEVVAVANEFERHHREGRTLEIFVLSNRWCDIGPAALKGPVPFPQWLYGSSDATYLSRLLSPQAVSLAVMRLKIWLGKARPELREDGYLDRIFEPASGLLPNQRPAEGASPAAPFPVIDMLAAHIAALPEQRAIAIVFAPLYAGILPIAGSAAAIRLDACKQRLREVAARRPGAAYLDLMTENSLTQAAANYFDAIHLATPGVSKFGADIAHLIAENGLRPE
jgi:hypothetical protein